MLYLGALSSFTTIAQLRVPAEIRGRVLAVFTVILGSLYPLGSVVQGKLADHIGLRDDDHRRRRAHGRRDAGDPAVAPRHHRRDRRAGRIRVASHGDSWTLSNGAATSRSSR